MHPSASFASTLSSSSSWGDDTRLILPSTPGRATSGVEAGSPPLSPVSTLSALSTVSDAALIDVALDALGPRDAGRPW
ncbi:hypothetical protein [Roseateles chitinivorans]|uniref:hypothetical protein n=1 Tax=Roseateles chitinivorans TaxID=2917965 RepID=UPI003D66AEBA